MSIILSDRKDRLGANFVSKIANFINGKISGAKILYNLDIRYPKSMFTIPFIKLCFPNNDNLKTTIKNYSGIRGNQTFPVIKLKQDLVSYFTKNYKEEFLNIIEAIANKRKYKLPWNDSTNIISIHLRCDDVYNNTDYNGQYSAHYIKDLIENDKFEEYDRKTMDSLGRDRQTCIDPKKLNNIIYQLKKIYPKKEINIIYSGKLNYHINRVIKYFNLKTHTNNDPDYDLWLLINSDILILSKSNFSLISGYFHKGTTVYYPIWGTFTSCGLYTKYDKSGWIPYI